MHTRTIQQTINFDASRREVYALLMKSKENQSLWGERARIGNNVGAKFSAWGGHVSGFHLELQPSKEIVQAWRATGWWPEHYSIAMFDIEKTETGSKLRFTQIGVPLIAIAGIIEAGLKRTGHP